MAQSFAGSMAHTERHADDSRKRQTASAHVLKDKPCKGHGLGGIKSSFCYIKEEERKPRRCGAMRTMIYSIAYVSDNINV